MVGQPTGTLYVTLSSGKVREVQLPLTADLELLNDPKPEDVYKRQPHRISATQSTTSGS